MKKQPSTTSTKPEDRKVVFKLTKEQWGTLRNDEIAAMHGCSAFTVYKFRRDNGLCAPPRKAGSGRKPRIRLDRINMKLTCAENAKKLGCTENWMYELMRKKRAGMAPRKKDDCWD